MSESQPRLVLNLRVTFEELLALQASVDASIAGLRGHLDALDNDADDRDVWERRLEIARSLSSRLDAYADDPVLVTETQGGS